jgi:hypothetical protein
MQVIIYTNSNGGVSVCVPTGELDIHATQAKDTPAGSVIVDDSTLPQGDDAQFFDAWQLSGSTVTVNQTKAQAIATANLNSMAKTEAQHRLTNTSIGLTNKLDDTAWLALLTTARSAIAAATNTSGLVAAVEPVQAAITANV